MKLDNNKPDRKTAREENKEELMMSGGEPLMEVREIEEMAESVREVLLGEDFSEDKLTSGQKRFVVNELRKLAEALHKEDHPNERLNQTLERGDTGELIRLARDYVVGKLKEVDRTNVVELKIG